MGPPGASMDDPGEGRISGVKDLINVFRHGGRSRRMLTIELGRAHKRGINFDSISGALDYIKSWLDREGSKSTVPDEEETIG